MTAMDQAITQYGYLAVFIGAVLEGETALLAGAVAAGGGLLNPWGVAICACLGGFASDLFFYSLGFFGGKRLLSRMPGIMARSERLRRRISGKSTGVILSSRFAYGLRSVIPLACSVSGVRPAKFIPLDLISGAIWSASYSLAGLGLGEWIAASMSRPAGLWLPLAGMALFTLCSIALAGLFKRRPAFGGKKPGANVKNGGKVV